jgi:hypothetical protein
MKKTISSIISLKTYLLNYFAFKKIASSSNYFQSLVAMEALLHPFDLDNWFGEIVQCGHSELEQAAFEVAEDLNIIIEFTILR